MEDRASVKIKEILEPGQCPYIPHHLVVMEDKITNKVGVILMCLQKVPDLVLRNVCARVLS